MPGQVQAGGPSVGAFLAAAGLAGTAGWVDAVAYLGLHAFVANMTGAVVVLGLSAAELDGAGMARQGLTVLAFLVGVVVSRLLRRLRQGPAPCYAVAALAVLACIGIEGAGQPEVWLLAAAMGLQNAAATVFGGVGLNTVFLTGNVQRLGETLADPAKPGVSRRFAAGLVPAVLLTYAAGAAGGGLAMRHLIQPLLPAVLALAAASVIALLRARTSRAVATSTPGEASPTLAPVTADAPAGRIPQR
ncbi:MAG TPA: YoaK family protein [Acetobacteraceae bacterium]